MPAAQYAPLPNRNDDEDGPDNEMDAAFESDDEQAPLTRPSDRADRALSPPPRTPAPAGTYDFEYDYPPPPGSPPLGPPTAYGNSNGIVPDYPVVRPQHQRRWYSRFAARIFPNRSTATTRGSGMENDGVFANVMAKPGGTAPRPTTDGDGIHYAPETTQSDAPPSYAVAQADAVPPYWETTILAPGAFGELLVDSLPAGSFFAFAWSLLVSATFQWVGFLLAYCVASTHAGRYGARAGLGITMVQFGVFLRAKPELTDIADDGTALWPWQSEEGTPPPPNGSYPTELPGNSTIPNYPPNGAVTYAQMGGFIEWLSLFTMTMGWFITFTSILGYWRVKRWENSLRASSPSAQANTSEDATPTYSHPLEHAFSLTMLRNGLGFSAHRSRDEEEGRPDPDDSRHTVEDAQLRANFRAVGLI